MKRLPHLACFAAVAALTATASSQTPQELEFAVNATPLVFTDDSQSGPYDKIIMKYGAAADERTVLFFHVTLDNQTGDGKYDEAITGLMTALPFLARPPASGGWSPADLAPLFSANDFPDFSGEDLLVIPPARLHEHLLRYINSNNQAGFGTTAVTSSFLQATTLPTFTGTADWDERQAFSTVTFASGIDGLPAFNPSDIGRASVLQAAHQFHNLHQPALPPLNEASIDWLNDMMNQDLGFEILAQPVHIKPPTGTSSRYRMRFGKHVVIRRLSLGQQQGPEPWITHYGPDRYVVHPLVNDVRVYLAPLNREAHIEIDPELYDDAGLQIPTTSNPTPFRVHVLTTSGYEIVQQLPNVTIEDDAMQEVLLRPLTVRILVPDNALTGYWYLEHEAMPGVIIHPAGAVAGAALMLAHDPTIVDSGTGSLF